ncbi:MAG TPA: biopolymer transporter ExbD [bacterium]|nr:biopolymer transporter ExbD [bacterium]
MAFKPSERSSRTAEDVELNMTPVMNLMVVLIPLLLSSAVFVKIGVIDLNLPPAVGANVSQLEAPKESEKKLDLAVSITDNGFYISSSIEIVRTADRSTPSIPLANDGSLNYSALSEKLYEIKQKALDQFPDVDRIVIQAEPDIHYQVLVNTMDAAREITIDSQKFVLFPEVSLAAGVIF